MKKAFYKNNAPAMYLFVLHRLAGKCTKFLTRAKPSLYDLLNPLFCDIFAAVMSGLCKISAVVVYKKSRCRLTSVLFASIFVI